MKDLLEIPCVLDVHKDKIVACILSGPIGKPISSEIREFTTLIPDMAALRDRIISCNYYHVAMKRASIGSPFMKSSKIPIPATSLCLL